MKSQTEEQLVYLTLALSPECHLYLDQGQDVQESLSSELGEHLTTLFAHGGFDGLLQLGVENFPTRLPPSFSFWQHYSRLFMTEMCKLYDFSQEALSLPACALSLEERQQLVNQAPFMKGAEYLNADLLEKIWKSLFETLLMQLKEFNNSLEAYLTHHNSSLSQVGRICFHLAENKNSEEHPFAFLVTYISRLSHESKLQHTPLSKAIQEYAGAKNSAAMLKLLLPIQRAAQESTFIKQLVENNEIYRTLLWTARQAHHFLKDIPLFETCGIMIRIPNWWNSKKPSRPQISITIGGEHKKQSSLGLQALVDFDLRLTLNDQEALNEYEWQQLLASKENFIKVKGQWVEVDQEKLQSVLSHWKSIQQRIKKNGLSFVEGMRLLAGASKEKQHNKTDTESFDDILAWSHVNAGNWLKEVLVNLQKPAASVDNEATLILKESLKATLRPYQNVGVEWLWLLYQLRLGGCLADDMGLGKTIQVLSLFLLVKHLDLNKKENIFLIVPASLLGNWQAEIARFAPSLRVLIVHSSIIDMREVKSETLDAYDVIITTYGFLLRMPLLIEKAWNIIVLDEAQTIKNPSAKQTQSVNTLKGNVKIALTGTPIENRLSDLWSIFNFTSPGLLGSKNDFVKYGKKQNFFSSIRTLVSPYILRRLKSDRRIIQDLPDKTEMQAFCNLSAQQAAMYQQAVDELERKLSDGASDMQRRGIVLAILLRLKQICNHPDQWLGYGSYTPELSGKFIRLQEICEQVVAKQEKVLIFTQFREIIPPLASFLAKIFGHQGFMLHGNTPVAQRLKLVESFQQEEGAQFFILSIKAGGTGLNLTQASHVIHFDRWWNPAVENQATDRAYRIGQKKNVLVHKFVCKGTIEEKIDDLIKSKKKLSQEILSHENELVLTELSDQDLIKIVSLDIHQAID